MTLNSVVFVCFGKALVSAYECVYYSLVVSVAFGCAVA